MSRLDDSLRAYYSGKHYPESRTLTPIDRNEDLSWYSRWTPLLATAALVLIGLGIISTLGGRDAERDVVFREIAMNHEKGLAVEIASANYDRVQMTLDRLTFDIRPTEEHLGEFELLGGRYCSINGRLAAQLKLRPKEGGPVHTLYVTELTPSLEKLGSDTKGSTDVSIRIWQDGSRFFGLAGPSATTAR